MHIILEVSHSDPCRLCRAAAHPSAGYSAISANRGAARVFSSFANSYLRAFEAYVCKS